MCRLSLIWEYLHPNQVNGVGITTVSICASHRDQKIMVFLFLRLTNGLHLVVNPLYSLWWSLLLIVDFDTYIPTSWRVFLIWPTVEKGFFFTREIIILLSTTVVFRGLPGLLVLLSSPVHSFFLRMFQTVDLATPNVFAISLIGLFWFFSLMMACFTDSDSSLDLILLYVLIGTHSKCK